MSTRSDTGSLSHSRSSSTASSGLLGGAQGTPAPPPLPPTPPTSAGRFSPSDHVSPEVTHSANPLHQLLQHQPPHQQFHAPPPHSQAPPSLSMPSQQQQQQFLQQFLSSSTNGMPMRSGPMPPPPMSGPVSFLSSGLPPYQQGLPSPGTFPPPRSAPSSLPPYPSQFHPVPSLSTASSTYQSGTRSVSVSSMDGSRSAHSSLAGSPRRNGTAGGDVMPATRPGVRLSGETVEYQARGEATPGESRSLEVMPITLYNSERTSQLGNLISVNSHFISYPIRNGLIRVISQSSVDRLLLRKHEHHSVTELAFFNSKSDLLLSSGTDHHVAIWGIQNDPMSRELLKLVPTAAQRVKWHPSDSNKIAIANGSVVFIADLSGVDADGVGAENLYDMSVVCGQTSGQINDMSFSPGAGESVITAGSDGFVQVYRVADRLPGQPAEFVHRFEPFHGEAVNSLHFYGGNFLNQPGLLIGGEGNQRLSLWNAALTESTPPTCYQTVILRDDATPREDATVIHETLLDPTSQFLFVADRVKPVVYAFHLALSVNARTPRRFDNVTEFALAYPVLSMGVLNRAAQGQSARDDLVSSTTGLRFSMQLYCLQTQAIQRYHVAATECYVPLAQEDEVPSAEAAVGENVGQTVGAMTTEGASMEMSYQTAAESPRAATAGISSPETEIDVQTHPEDNDEVEHADEQEQQASINGSTAVPSSPSARSTGARSLHLVGDDAASVTGEDGTPSAPPSLRFYSRSSPSSSVRAFQDEASVQYDPSVDGTVSEREVPQGDQHSLLAALRHMEASQLQRDEQMREQMRGVLDGLDTHLSAQVAAQVDKSIQKQLQTVLVPAMGRIVLHTMENNFMKPVQNGFQHVINEKLIPQMEHKLNESLSESLPTQLDNSVDDMVQRVVEDVRQPVRESFRECFQEIIIPSFQAATQKMFEQINDTFVQGTRSAFESSGQSSSNAQVTAQLQQLTQVVNGLSKQVEQLSATMNGTPNTLVPVAKSAEELQLETQKNQVLDFIARSDWEEAFKLALGAQSVDLVSFTCQQCDPRAVLCSRPPKLSQMLILCLVQQLGADLADDLTTKLNWLRESLLVMDVKDPSISGFVASVLTELQAGLNSVPHQFRDSQYTLLHHVLNSMLSSA